MSSTTYHGLKNNWVLWGHHPHDNDWSMKGFYYIHRVGTVEELVTLIKVIHPSIVNRGMLFLMREGVEPRWEDAKNRNGGCFSYKVNKSIYDVWDRVIRLAAGNTLSPNKNVMNNVMGIAISPKKNFCILKVWMTDKTYQNASVFTEVKGLSAHGCLFKPHVPTS